MPSGGFSGVWPIHTKRIAPGPSRRAAAMAQDTNRSGPLRIDTVPRPSTTGLEPSPRTARNTASRFAARASPVGAGAFGSGGTAEAP